MTRPDPPMDSTLADDLRPLCDAFRCARRLFVVTGAGVSAESGLPTFRGPNGMWRGRDPMELASPAGFRHDPALVWEFYNERRIAARAAAPNPAHLALAAMEAEGVDLFLMTQNVDRLHARAGSRKFVELHGNLFESRCSRCGAPPFEDGPRPAEEELPPRCGACAEPLRPNVVWFGEYLPAEPFRAFSTWLEAGRVDGCLVVGTSALFGYLHECVERARRAGAIVGEISLDDEPKVGPDFFLRAKAGVALPALRDAMALARAHDGLRPR